MNNHFISKIASVISFIIIAGVVAPLAPVHAAATFNTDPLDYPTIQVTNYSRNAGCTSCWSTSAMADAGDIISVLVYYHNTSGETAQQTKVRASVPTVTNNYHTISGDVWAQNGSVAHGSASISASSNQTLSYIPGSAKWYPNRSTNQQNFLNGQSGDEVISGGLIVGDLASGWANQGYVTFRVRVGNNGNQNNPGGNQGSAPAILSFSANSTTENATNLTTAVDRQGSNTNVWFEYGTNSSLGSRTIDHSITGSGSQSVTHYLSGLSANTTYYFRVAAQNQYGTTYSSITSFTTTVGQTNNGNAPIVTTRYASSVSENYATLNGSVDPNNSATTVWFEYGTNSSLGNRTSNRTLYGDSNIDTNEYISGLNNNAVYSFRIVASNQYGTTYGNTLTFTTSNSNNNNNSGSYPSVQNAYATSIGQNFASLNATINPNGNDTSYWFEYGTSMNMDQRTGYQSIGSGNGSQSISTYVYNLLPNTYYYFRAAARNNYGTNYSNVASFTTTYQNQNYNNYQPAYATAQPNVTTVAATFVYSTFASLNGTVNPNNWPADVWFEWGETTNLGNTTVFQNVSANYDYRQFSYALTNLRPLTAYYFRAVARNTYGTSYGSIFNFTTQAAVATTPVYTPPATVIYTPAPVVTSSGQQMIITSLLSLKKQEVGQEVTYTVLYKNGGRGSVKNAILSIALPSEVEYENSNVIPDTIEEKQNIIRYNIGTIPSNDEGTVTIQVKVKDSPSGSHEALFIGSLKYTNSNGANETAKTELALEIEPSRLTAFLGSIPAWLLGILIVVLGIWFVVWIMQSRKQLVTEKI